MGVVKGDFPLKAPPGGPSGDTEMQERLARLETKFDTTLPQLATKADVSESKSDIIKWLAGLLFAATAMTITVLVGAINSSKSTSQPLNLAPIVIQVPAAPAAQQPDKAKP